MRPPVGLLLLCCLCLGLGLQPGQLFGLPPVDRDVERLGEATLHVASRYIATRINTLLVRQHCHNCSALVDHQQRQLVDQLLQQLALHMSILFYRLTAYIQQPWDYTLIVVNEAEAFEQLHLNYTHPLQEREFYFLIVLMARLPESELHRSVGRMCNMALLKRIINVVVLAMTRSDDDQIKLYSYRLFREHCTPGIHTYRSNQFRSDGSLLHPELFPVRFTNLSNCAFNVTGHVLPPHFMYRAPDGADLPADGALIDMHDLHGIGGELLRLLATALRFRVHLKIPMEKSEIFSTDSLSGCLAQLAAGEAELAIGGFSGSDIRRHMFSTSSVYHQSYFIFVVRSERYLGPFGQLIRPFESVVWLCLLATLLAALICVRCLGRRLRLQHPVENLLASTTGNPVPTHRVPQSSFLRHLLANWLLLTLVLRCAYQAKLFDVLRIPKQQPLPQGLAGLLRQNYTLLSSGYHDFYPRQLTQLTEGNFSQRYRLLQQARRGSRLVTISLDNNLAHWQRQHRRSSRLTHIREPIYLYQLVIYFPNSTILKFSIDRKIEQLLSSGVLAHIERRYLSTPQLGDVGSNVELVTRITNDMLHGLYRCYAALMALAGLLLLLECLAGRRLRRLLDWLQ
ncbi:PREDICTED: uncharacterized protein LOC108618090 [Drosophila arizonae]|uniref:Uncharacterized protein LOC108618090 n=1 Tax=Drosophila arizonae TaxID=7263 RepID=A0ABM1PQJ9_DROAR|nr:PREDICTED: uncharacterized protein LOC108618090 [Drosophila arizonae]